MIPPQDAQKCVNEPDAVTLEDEGSKLPDPVIRIVSPENGPKVANAVFGPMRLNECALLVACAARTGTDKTNIENEARMRTDALDSFVCNRFCCIVLCFRR